jgi:hypothetical protein
MMMKGVKRSVVAFLAVCSMLIGSMAYAQTTPPAETKPAATDGSAWQFNVTPYAWLIAMDTKTIVRDRSVESNVPFSEIFQNLDVAGQVHFEARKGKWGFFLDPSYLKLAHDGTLRGGRDVRVQVEQWLVEVGGFYELGKWSLEESKKRSMTLDVLGGGRYWYMSANLDMGTIANPSKTTQWVDPFVGARFTADMTERLLFSIRGDVGGFGAGSDFSWNGLGYFGYRFTKNITALLGYRALYVDYKEGTSVVRYKATIHGPIGGLSFSF